MVRRNAILLARGPALEDLRSLDLERHGHPYQEVDLGIVADVVENHLDDLLQFAIVIRRRL